MRLIDADALPKYTGYALSADEVAKAVENAPTIEAEPVRRGRWLQDSFLTDTILCSNCGFNLPTEEMASNYCPNCGAKMEE